MKTLLTILTTVALAVGTLHANSTRCASFYLNTPEKYEGQKITLYVAEVDRRGAIEGQDSVIFSAYTKTRDGSEGAFIDVIVPKAKADTFARRYGTEIQYINGKPRLISMRGVLRQIKDIWYLEFGGE